MRVSADLDLCQGHQMCQLEAPAVFGLNEDEDKVALLDANPPEQLRADVQRAVTYCPAMALSLED
jgi:ferredoxin